MAETKEFEIVETGVENNQITYLAKSVDGEEFRGKVSSVGRGGTVITKRGLEAIGKSLEGETLSVDWGKVQSGHLEDYSIGFDDMR